MALACPRITERGQLLQYIIDHKAQAGLLSTLTDEEIRSWAEDHSTEFLHAIATGLWKDTLTAAGLRP